MERLKIVGYGYAKGEKTNFFRVALALIGFIAVLAPFNTAPLLDSSALMLASNIARGEFGRAGDSP